MLAKIKGLCYLAIIASLSFINISYGNSFFLLPQTAQTIANSGSNLATSTKNGSAAWYNPAAMTQLKHVNGTFSGIFGIDHIKFRGTTTANNAAIGYSETATGSTANDQRGFLPTAMIAWPIGKFAFGLAFGVPFAFTTDFSADVVAQYSAAKTSLSVYDIRPSIAYAVLPTLSISAALDIESASLESNTTILVDANDKGSNEANLSSTALGYHLGLLWHPWAATLAGLTYRSQAVHHLSGDGHTSVAFYTATTSPTHATARLTLPPIWTLSLSQGITKKLTAMSTINYIQWDKFRRLTIKNAGYINIPALGTAIDIDLPLTEGYKNAWRFALGGGYQVTKNLQLLAGGSFDQTPVRKKYRSFSGGADGIAASLGLNYSFIKNLDMHVGYTHVFYRRVSVQRSLQYKAFTNTLSGHATQHDDLFGLQFNWRVT